MFEVYSGKDGKWYWRFRAANGLIIADGGQGYASRRGVVRAVRTVCLAMRDLALPWPIVISLKSEHGIRQVKG